MELPVLFVISILPVFIIAVVLYVIDKEKEAIGTMFKFYALGLLAAVMAVIVELFVQIDTNGDIILIFIDCFFGISLIEESAKLVSLRLGLAHEKSYDNFYDSIIFATAVSLGFAGIENLLYVLFSSFQSLSLGIGTGLLRAFLAVPGHVIFSIYMGYFLDKAVGARVKGKSPAVYNALALIVPTILHGIYDFFCFTLTGQSPGYLLLFVLYIAFMYISGVTLVVIGAKRSNIPFIPNANLYRQFQNNHYTQVSSAPAQVRTCINCNSPISGNFCSQCGYDNSNIPSNVNPFMNQSGKICPYCGNVSNGSFCTRCGTPL